MEIEMDGDVEQIFWTAETDFMSQTRAQTWTEVTVKDGLRVPRSRENISSSALIILNINLF